MSGIVMEASEILWRLRPRKNRRDEIHVATLDENGDTSWYKKPCATQGFFLFIYSCLISLFYINNLRIIERFIPY